MSGSRADKAVLVDGFACADELGLVFPKARRFQTLAQRALNSIWNAWLDAGLIAPDGTVWVKFQKLHTILRVGSNARARRLITYHVPDRFIQKCREDYCLHGRYVVMLMDLAITESGDTRRSDYARFSEKVYRRLRDSPVAEKRRMDYAHSMKLARRRLKKERIKMLGLTKDELTDETLNSRQSDFSHIRSASLFPHISAEYWNGLVINKTTHERITKCDVLDEDDLMALCVRERWKTDWIRTYKAKIDILG